MVGRPVEPLGDGDPRRLGPYPLEGILGEGGMGTVYLGRGADESRVAIKAIRSEFVRHPEFRARFLREAGAASRVARFCTAAVVDVDTSGNQPYLVTEFIDGPTLAEAVAADGPMSGSALDHLAVATASALTAIHSAGLVHRDLKPGNVLLSATGPRVIDFGVARTLDSAGTITSLSLSGIVGTPGFMAPEQALGREATAAADVFAWGGVMLFAATGRAPFGDGQALALLYQVVHAEPDLAGLAPEFRRLVERAMHKDPTQRPTAADLYDLLIANAADPTGVLVPPVDEPATAATEVTVHPEAAVAADTPADEPADTGMTAGDGAAADVAAPAAGASGGRPRPTRWTWADLPRGRARAVRYTLAGACVAGVAAAAVVVAATTGGSGGDAPRIAPTGPVVAGAPGPVGTATATAAGSRTSGRAPTSSGSAAAGSATADPAAAGPGAASAPSGARTTTTATVTPAVSGGPGQITVPDVLNQTEAAARQRLAAFGLTATTRIDTGPTTVAAGLVETVRPGVGSAVAPGATVTLTVVSGRVAVPNVVALPCDTASGRLRAAGLTPSAVGTQALNGKVASQNPQAGALADRGTTVTIVCLLR